MISSVIHQSDVPAFNAKLKDKSDVKIARRKTSSGMRIIELARERQYSVKKLFMFDLVDNEFLFDKNGMTEVTISMLKELEKLLVHPAVTTLENCNCCCIVNAIYYLKKIPTAQIKTFGDLVTSFLKYIGTVIPDATTRIDFVFNSVKESSPKSLDRITASKTAMKINKIEKDTRLPVKMALFWSSYENEMKLQNFMKTFILDSKHFGGHVHIYCSAYSYKENNFQCESWIEDSKVIHRDLAYFHLEEG